MERAERRRQAKQLDKQLKAMSLKELETFIVTLFEEGEESGIAKTKEAISKVLGIGEKRFEKVQEYLTKQKEEEEK